MSLISLFLQNGTTANAGADAAAGGLLGGSGMMLFPLVAILLIMYFLMIRPQNKKQKETQKMIDALKKGDKVITIGGIHGVVSSTKENTVVIKVDDGTKIEFNRTAISTVIVDKPANAPEEEKRGLFGRKKASSVAKEIKESDKKDSVAAEKAAESGEKDE
jgi:preprotein translocase subunit YajC